MLQTWLDDDDPTASWDKIIKGIESPAICDDRRSQFQSWVSNDNKQNSSRYVRSLSDNLLNIEHQIDLLETRLRAFFYQK